MKSSFNVLFTTDVLYKIQYTSKNHTITHKRDFPEMIIKQGQITNACL